MLNIYIVAEIHAGSLGRSIVDPWPFELSTEPFVVLKGQRTCPPVLTSPIGTI